MSRPERNGHLPIAIDAFYLSGKDVNDENAG